MTYYAQYDSSAPQPTPVLGWYDTSLFSYRNLPAEADLLELDEIQWKAHFENPSGWAFNDGIIVERVFDVYGAVI
jgi:hypothetical protein